MRVIEEIRYVKRAARGDPGAFEELVNRYQGPIYNLCFRMVGNAEDAADMTQEAFIKAWKNLDSFQFEAAFSTWLYRLASNCCLDFLRSKKRRPTISLVTTNDEDEEQTVDVEDNAPGPEEQLLSGEDREILRKALAEIDLEQRQILTLRVVNDLSYGEIAEILGIKEGTVKSRLSRARENLRKKVLQIGNKT